MRHSNHKRTLMALAAMVCCQWAAAKCGGVDYSWGADGLAKAHDYVITMLMYVVYLVYAVLAVLSVIASLQIYIKMNAGDNDIKKEIMMVVGSILFIIGCTIVLPAFFGYQL